MSSISNEIPNYRSVLLAKGVRIVVDVGTRDNGGEAHLLLLKDGSKIGFVTVHDKYATGLAPMFSAPSPFAVSRFEKRLENSIQWGDAREIYSLLRDEENLWEKHPMWERNRTTCLGFLLDAGEILRSLFSVTK